MSKGWPLVALGDIFVIARGGSPRPIDKFITNDPNGINWIMISDATESSKYITQAKKRIVREGVKKSRMVHPGDFLLTNSMSFGKPYIMKTSGCIHDGWLVLSPRDGNADPDYFYHMLGSEVIYSKFERLASGATVKNLNIDLVKGVKVPLPPLVKQRQIAEVLDRTEALRAKRHAIISQLDMLSQSIFIEMFGDPVSNQKKWAKKKFSEIGTLDRGVSKHRPRNAPELLGGPYPLVQTGEVANCDGYIRNHHSTYSEIGLRQSKIWPAGTLCVTIAANIAMTGILTFDACFPDSIVGFRSDEPSTVEFVRAWLSFLQKTLEESAPESAQKNINLAILRNLEIPFPPVDLQCEFARRIAAVEKLKTVQRTSLKELNALFASLQNRAFQGDL